MVVRDMSDGEVEALLRERGAGVLALTDSTETYAVPQSFGYDEGTIYFHFVSRPDSEKETFMQTTESATFTVFTESIPARSVVVRGSLERIPPTDHHDAMSAIAANATVPALDTVGDGLEELSMDYYRLSPREMTGRVFGV